MIFSIPSEVSTFRLNFSYLAFSARFISSSNKSSIDNSKSSIVPSAINEYKQLIITGELTNPKSIAFIRSML